MFKRKGKSDTEEGRTEADGAQDGEPSGGLFSRLKAGLAKTRASFTEGLYGLVAGRRQIDDELLEELELPTAPPWTGSLAKAPACCWWWG